jgi:GTPase Era involved in 16S rRNA processing
MRSLCHALQRVVDSALHILERETKEELWKLFKRNVSLKLRVKIDKRQTVDTSQWL